MPGERIADLIRRAGGFTETAFLKAAVFTRRSVVNREQLIDKKLDTDVDKALLQSTVRAPSSLTSPQVQLAAVQEIRAGYLSARKSNANGRVLIQLEDLKDFEKSSDNLEIENGDELFIPTFQNTVLVKGETFGEAAIPAVEGRNIEEYLKLFGGIRDSADPEDIYIIRANGRVVLNAYPSELAEAGDTIVVPPNLTPKESTIKESTTVVDVIFKTVSTIAILYTIGVLVP